jgi:hypothetical protein
MIIVRVFLSEKSVLRNVHFTLFLYKKLLKVVQTINKHESSRSCRASLKNLGQKSGGKIWGMFGTHGLTDKQTEPSMELLCNEKTKVGIVRLPFIYMTHFTKLMT